MAFSSADNTRNGTAARPLRLGLALGWLCLAAARAHAEAPAVPLAHSFTTNSSAPAPPLLLPLNVQFGHGSGVSFLYNLAAAPTEGNKTAAAPRAATYGFSNALAFGHDALHLNGLMYLANGPGGDGKNKASSVVSQALAFENKGWKLDAHYQSVGKDFGAADALKGAAPALGLASDLTAAVAGQLAGMRGQSDLGFGLTRADAHGSLGASFKENDNAVSHLKTTRQTLSLGHSFGHGFQFEASRDALNAKPTGGDGGQGKALTTTTDHLKLGMDGGRGLTFSAEANLIGDTKGRAEQHLAYAFADQLKDTHFAARFGSNSLQNGGDKAGGKATDQTLGLDIDRQTKALGLKASVVQFAATGKDGDRQTRTAEHLELAMKDTKIVVGLQSDARTGKDGGRGAGDKTLLLDLTRQTRGLSLKASLLRSASTAPDGADKDGNRNSEKRDLTATLDALRLRGLRNTRAVLNLAQAVSQGKMQSDTRALCFESDLADAHVRLEYTGAQSGWDKARSTLVSRAVRVASIAPGDWLHYSLYYKTRTRTLGGHLADIRDYTVGMRTGHVTLAYHYLNQLEQPDGSVRDSVLSHYEADGALTRKLAWNLQYEQTDDRAGRSGLESWLAGFKGDLTPRQSIALMLGRPELRVDGTTVPGQTFKMTFTCKMDDDDSIAFNGEVTNWERKTKDSPSTVTGTFRLDVKKGF